MENQEQEQAQISEVQKHIQQADEAMQEVLYELQPKSLKKRIIHAITCWMPVSQYRIRKDEKNILRLTYSVLAANKQLIIILDAAERKRAEKAMEAGLKDQDHHNMYG